MKSISGNSSTDGGAGWKEDDRQPVRGVTPSGIFYGKWWISASLNSATRVVAIATPFWKVFNFLSDPKNLLQWAVTDILVSEGRGAGQFEATTSVGSIEVSMRIEPKFGIVDLSVAKGQPTWHFFTRVLANSDRACEFIVTVISPSLFGSKLFDASTALVDKKLDRLKLLMEERVTSRSKEDGE